MNADILDVVIVGAGLSGIGTARHLQPQLPDCKYAILEGRQAIGGTWDIFRYPGIRSDSDMFTLGYKFKPWRGGKVLADGPAIRSYVQETARENGIEPHIHFGHRVVSAAWSSEDACWTVTADTGNGNEAEFRCRVLYTCAGYYSYKQGYTPDIPGMDEFQGTVIHPQFWPEDLDYSGKRVVIVGSGATAVTLVPAMADSAASVTMLQRSPTYMINRPEYDPVWKLLDKFLPTETAYRITRWMHVREQWLIYTLTRVWPGMMKRLFISRARKQLPEGYDVDTHFTPSYNPWDQRLCAVPENDLFKVISEGKAEVVTDQIAHFTEKGIALKSGKHLEADIVVTATGLDLVMAGEVAFSMDGEPLDLADSYTYKGIMFSGVPNLLNIFGYINSSWTLRADLLADFLCRLVAHMRDQGARKATPQLRPEDSGMQRQPYFTDFSANYFHRVAHRFPSQGDREPWLNCQNYTREKRTIGRAPLEDGVLVFEK